MSVPPTSESGFNTGLRYWKARCAELTDELERMREREMQILVAFYDADYSECARVCDEELDRSGKLLGRVREEANFGA